VVKPRISTFTPQRSSVRARMSAHDGCDHDRRPRIEPELSSRSVTTVSRNLLSSSILKDRGAGRIDDDAGEARGVEHAFFQVEHPANGSAAPSGVVAGG